VLRFQRENTLSSKSKVKAKKEKGDVRTYDQRYVRHERERERERERENVITFDAF
jgi:hypothetical protein